MKSVGYVMALSRVQNFINSRDGLAWEEEDFARSSGRGLRASAKMS